MLLQAIQRTCPAVQHLHLELVGVKLTSIPPCLLALPRLHTLHMSFDPQVRMLAYAVQIVQKCMACNYLLSSGCLLCGGVKRICGEELQWHSEGLLAVLVPKRMGLRPAHLVLDVYWVIAKTCFPPCRHQARCSRQSHGTWCCPAPSRTFG